MAGPYSGGLRRAREVALTARVDALDSEPVEVTGIHGDNAALISLLTVLESLGLITDSTTAA